MRPPSARDGETGFSLLEVLVSILLVTVACVALLQALGLSLQVLQRSRALRQESLQQWNRVQRWRAAVDASPRPDPAGPLVVHRFAWPATPAGVKALESSHGDR